ncbi:helix-turn-helix domain-containing protein [Cupriavidus agavae]|nr:AraC family transcriptional regulator [Cupriavidus agavae]
MTAMAASDAAVAISDILDQPPTLANIMRGGTRLTRRWRHGEFHASLPAMDTHVIMTYYGVAQNSSCRVDGKRVSARTRPGTVTIIPAGQEGRWDVEGPIEVSHVYLGSDRLQEAASLMALGTTSIELVGRICVDDPVASRILEILSHEAATGDPSSSLFADHALDLLCAQLVRGHSAQSAMPAPTVRKGLVDWQVRRVTDYMKDSLDQEIRLDDLAGLLQMSRFHFCTAFRLATGQTPHEWLTALRIGHARHLLITTEMPVTSIGMAVGYQTPSSFASAFRKVSGVTPSSLRRSR